MISAPLRHRQQHLRTVCDALYNSPHHHHQQLTVDNEHIDNTVVCCSCNDTQVDVNDETSSSAAQPEICFGGINFYCTILQSYILTSQAIISAQNNFQGLIWGIYTDIPPSLRPRSWTGSQMTNDIGVNVLMTSIHNRSWAEKFSYELYVNFSHALRILENYYNLQSGKQYVLVFLLLMFVHSVFKCVYLWVAIVS